MFGFLSPCRGRWCPHSVKTRCLTWKSKLKNTLAMFMPFLEERKYSRGELLTSELATISLAASVGDGDSTTDVRDSFTSLQALYEKASFFSL